MKPLYEHPEIYRQVFQADEEEHGFFRGILCASDGGWLVDLGCGESTLAAGIWESDSVIGIDLSMEMLRGLGNELRSVQANIWALPFANGAASAVMSRLFGVSYALAVRGGDADGMVAELRRILRPGGLLALELPVCYRPGNIIGFSEKAAFAGGYSYEFQYLDVLEEAVYGFVLDSRIQVLAKGEEFELRAPLFVFRPDGVTGLLSSAGFTAPVFFAPYDAATRTTAPPKDVLRAVVLTKSLS